MTQSVVRREGLSRRRFVRDYLWPNRPVVVTGALNDWVGLTKWNIAFFQSKLGHEPVCLQGDTFNSTRTIPFAEYLEAVATYLGVAGKCAEVSRGTFLRPTKKLV